jgi:hypothetical protein
MFKEPRRRPDPVPAPCPPTMLFCSSDGGAQRRTVRSGILPHAPAVGRSEATAHPDVNACYGSADPSGRDQAALARMGQLLAAAVPARERHAATRQEYSRLGDVGAVHGNDGLMAGREIHAFVRPCLDGGDTAPCPRPVSG